MFFMHSHALGAIVVFLGRSKKWGSTGHVAADGKGPKGELFFFARSQKNIEKLGKKCDWEWLRKSGLGDVYIDVAWYWIDLDSFNGFNLGAVWNRRSKVYSTLGFSKITVVSNMNLGTVHVLWHWDIWCVFCSNLWFWGIKRMILRIRKRGVENKHTSSRALCFFVRKHSSTLLGHHRCFISISLFFLNLSWEAMYAWMVTFSYPKRLVVYVMYPPTSQFLLKCNYVCLKKNFFLRVLYLYTFNTYIIHVCI